MSSLGSYLFTSESVTEGHPDKIATRYPTRLDAVLERIEKDVCGEDRGTTARVVFAGEIPTSTVIDFSQVARETVKELVYKSKIGFDCDT